VFVLEWLNAVATTYFFYDIYFFTQSKFGFDKFHNLLLAAGLGLAYMFAAILGGRFAQRAGYFRAYKVGQLVMAAALSVGSQLDHLSGLLAVMLICVFGMGMTWPALQALVSEGETRLRLRKMVGIYNLVWSFGGALAYLTGGAMIETFGLRSLFFVPAAMAALQLLIALSLEAQPGAGLERIKSAALAESPQRLDPAAQSQSPVSPRIFLKIAWLANPFAYLAINTVIAVSPSLARTLSLTPRYAGYFCSVWMFVRGAAFALFWLWPGWHYRFRWLATAYAGMTASFVSMLLSPNLAVLIASQIGFGLFIGLIYYSSLFYSMDVGETKGEHGGLHEGAIGAGSCAGPAVGAAALAAFPEYPHSGAWGVSGLLLLGFLGLLWLRFRPQPDSPLPQSGQPRHSNHN
jgi:MFS family permease